MTFPVYLDFFGLRLHPHLVFEGVGYFVGARLYFRSRRASRELALSLDQNLWLLVGCIFGAWAGSKLLAWAEAPHHYAALLHTDPWALFGGKTIVGGLLGGWAGIEVAKTRLRLTRSTGDAFVWPLAVGTALGRVGCFLTGLADRTYGTVTSLPWAVDFGDGFGRHPTQLYESLFVVLLALAVYLPSTLAARPTRHPPPSGTRFRLYFAGYFAFRFAIEFIKPRETPFLALSAIQLASLAGLTVSLLSLLRLSRIETEGENRNSKI